MKNDNEEQIEHQSESAARAIAEADVLLLVTGAGWSADSGLPIYDDIAKVPAYEKQGLTYSDVSQPKWLETNPGLFYGFWGRAMDDYRTTIPHSGYSIITEWREDKRAKSPELVASILERVQAKRHYRKAAKDSASSAFHGPAGVDAPYEIDELNDMSGAFYSFTSNCDAHFYDFLPAADIHDCHGNVELWQCSNRDCESGLWRAPLEFSIQVDKRTMIAPEMKAGCSEAQRGKDSEENARDDSLARLGHSQGQGIRDNLLHFMPKCNDKVGWEPTTNESVNWPRCGHCKELARPAIFMFGDFGWKYDKAQDARWNAWRESIVEHYKAIKLNVCVVEIGCGKNVATCRNVSEGFIRDLNQGDITNKATLVRINPDFAGVDDEKLAEHTISIPSKGLAAMKKIQSYYAEILPANR